MENRLKDLRAEAEKGNQRVQQLEQELNAVRATLLRIGGAIQVIEEMLNEKEGENES